MYDAERRPIDDLELVRTLARLGPAATWNGVAAAVPWPVTAQAISQRYLRKFVAPPLCAPRLRELRSREGAARELAERTAASLGVPVDEPWI